MTTCLLTEWNMITTVKTCFKCGAEKPLMDFYKQKGMADGHVNKCKECTKKDVLNHRLANIEAIRAYDKRRSMLPHRVAARLEYMKTPAYAESHKRSLKKQIELYPGKAKARWDVSNALRDKKLTRPNECKSCGIECEPHGHHEDYSKPLDVIWLCAPCHAERHRQIKSETSKAA